MAIRNYLPRKEEFTTVTIDCSKKKKEKVQKLMRKEGITWVQFLDAAFSDYIASSKNKEIKLK